MRQAHTYDRLKETKLQPLASEVDCLLFNRHEVGAADTKSDGDDALNLLQDVEHAVQLIMEDDEDKASGKPNEKTENNVTQKTGKTTFSTSSRFDVWAHHFVLQLPSLSTDSKPLAAALATVNEHLASFEAERSSLRLQNEESLVKSLHSMLQVSGYELH